MPFDSSNRSPGIRAVRPKSEGPEKIATSGALGRSTESKTERGRGPTRRTSLLGLEEWRRYQTCLEVRSPAQFQPTTHPAAASCRNQRSEQLQKTSPWVLPRRSYSSQKRYVCKSEFFPDHPVRRDSGPRSARPI